MATRLQTGKHALLVGGAETYLLSNLAGGAADKIQYVATGCAVIGMRLSDTVASEASEWALAAPSSLAGRAGSAAREYHDSVGLAGNLLCPAW